MPARTPWQKTAEFVDGLKGKLPDWELAEIKRYVEKRCRKEAQAQAQMTAKPVGTVQHCSPILPNPDMPSNAFVKLENNEGTMSQELEELTSSSAGIGLETPGQQGPPNEGTLEQRQTTANGFLTAGVGSSKERNIATSTKTVSGISSIAATPPKRRHKTSSEENKQFDPGGRGEKALECGCTSTFLFLGRSWEASCLSVWGEAGRLLVCLSGAKLGGFLSVCLGRSWEASCLFRLCPVCVFVFPKLLIYPGETYQQDERRGSWTPIKSLMYATGGQAIPGLVVAQTLKGRAADLVVV